MNDLLFSIVDRKTAKQVFLYGAIGVSRNLLGYLLYLLITYLGVPPKIAVTLLYGFGTMVGFLANRKFVFAHKGNMFGAGARYIMVYLLGYLLNIAIIIVMVDRLGYPHQWVQAAAIFVVAGFLFISLKLFVFPAHADNDKDIDK